MPLNNRSKGRQIVYLTLTMIAFLVGLAILVRTHL